MTLELESFEAAIWQKEWLKSMREEVKTIKKNKQWELSDLPDNKKVIEVKWVYKTKLNPNGSINKHKRRLIARINYNETFTPIACLDTIRALIALATQS